MGSTAYSDEFQAGYNRALVDINGELLLILRDGTQLRRKIQDLYKTIGEIVEENITGTLKERLTN